MDHRMPGQRVLLAIRAGQLVDPEAIQGSLLGTSGPRPALAIAIVGRLRSCEEFASRLP
jgi:hypothetical protein